MYIYENMNPKYARVGDCVIRALSSNMKRSWDSVYSELAGYGYSMKDMPSSNAVFNALLKDHGYKREIISDQCPECYTVRDFCRDHPNGFYILGTGSHVISVKNGDYYDTWDSGNEIPVYYYWKE